jgi:hypothetical protein
MFHQVPSPTVLSIITIDTPVFYFVLVPRVSQRVIKLFDNGEGFLVMVLDGTYSQ